MRHILPFVAILIVLSSACSIAQQFPNVRVSSPWESPEEVTIALNPLNPRNLLAAANLSFYAYSNDGGYTWTEQHLTSQYGVWGDPSVIFDQAGNAYIGHLSNPSSGYWLDRLVVHKSSDGGVTWNDGTSIGAVPPTQQDKEWLIADASRTPSRNNLYMCWTQFDKYASKLPKDSSRILFCRSTDFGATWSPAVRVGDRAGDCLDLDSTVQGAVPAVGPEGEIYTSWSGVEGILFDKSTDGGLTFGTDRFVSDQPGGWDIAIPGIQRCNGFPVTLCDLSDSSRRGAIYIVWADQRNGAGNTDIFLSRSIDRGTTWSDRHRVNQDNGFAQQFFHWATIDQSNGDLYVVYYDRRAAKGLETEVYVSKSTDGGETFTDLKVSRAPFTPDVSVFLGDYIGIAALNGVAHPIWSRLDSGRVSVWTAIIGDTARAGIVRDDAGHVGDMGILDANFEPFSSFAKIYLTLPSDLHITVAIHNSLGQLVSTLADGDYPSGLTTLWWNGMDSAGRTAPNGMYFVVMTSGERQFTRKVMVVR
ncbi:MAG: FlgD immunoglobulin-like domain containing protein [Candidatus Kapaibacterium sp.]